MSNQIIKSFLFTVKEYKRFAEYFQSNKEHELLDDFTNDDYIAIQTKLMLLRKYGTRNKHNSVYLKDVLECAKKSFKEYDIIIDSLVDKFEKVQKNEFETIFYDGSSLTLYNTIKYVMYGVYLHADSEKIESLLKIDPSLLFVVTRKYVEELEKVVLETYELLDKLVEDKYVIKEFTKASVIAIINGQESVDHKITGSPFWSNLYGKDAGIDDFNKILGTNSLEDNIIIIKGICFIEECLKNDYNQVLLRELIYPSTLSDWGDFKEIHNQLIEIKNIGWSSKIRYNDRHDMAYMNIYHNVEDPFIINQPQVFYGNASVLTFVKDKKDDWKIFCFGDKLEDFLIKGSIVDYVKYIIKRIFV